VTLSPPGPAARRETTPTDPPPVNLSVELETVAGRIQSEEVLAVTHPDGGTERMRLHEYERVYAIPGLYEEVVQRRLECASPAKIAEAVVDAAAVAGQEASTLRVFDLGAGNGVVAEELARRGVGTFVGLDNIAEAREAAERDRPGLYAEYLVGDLGEHPRVPGAIAEHALNCLVAVGALGMGHISAASFEAAWRRFPAGSWLGVTIPEELAEPGSSDFGDLLAAETSAGRLEVVARERYRHRLLMDGSEVFYVAIVGHLTV
jgi:SAM-dependent methyltransferase